MPHSLKDYFYGAALSFLGMVTICIALYPSIFEHYGYGISEFGAIRATVVPFFMGFAATIYFLIRIGLSLRRTASFLSVFFLTTAVCLGGIAITSYPLNRFTYDLHWWFVSALVLNILIAMIWRLQNGAPATLDRILAALFLITTIVSVLPLVRDIPLFNQFILRELIIFISSFWFMARAALSAHPAPINVGSRTPS